MILNSAKSEYIVLTACAKEWKFVSMLLEAFTKVQKPSIIYKDDQGEILLAKNRQVCIYLNTSIFVVIL